MILRCLPFLSLVLAGTGVFCQVNDYPFSRLDIRDGLSNNHVTAIFKDHRGYIWFGTQSGLDRYDGYSFKVFFHADPDSSSLMDIEGIFEGPEDKLYINTPGQGINVYDPSKERFLPSTSEYLQKFHLLRYGLVGILRAASDYYFVYRDSGVYRLDAERRAFRIDQGQGETSVSKSPVMGAAMDSSGGLWLSHFNGLLERLDLKSNKITARMVIPQDKGFQWSSGYKLFIDRQQMCWLYAPGRPSGLWQFDRLSGTLAHFCRDSGRVRLSSNIVFDVTQDDKGIIWIATDKGGLVLLDKTTLTVLNLRHTDEERSLPENTISALYRDNTGMIWAGTLKNGIGYYQRNMLRFPLYKRQPGVPGSLPYDDVSCFTEDGKGNLWIGTDGGGLIYFDRPRNTFTSYCHNANDDNSISSNVEVALKIDHKGRLWIGTYQGGLDCYDGRRFIHHKHKDSDPSSLSDDRVYALSEDAGGDLWVGTLEGGLDRFDIARGKFYHNDTSMPYSLRSDCVTSLADDSAANLWIGTAYGIDVLRRNTGKYMSFIGENSKLSNNVVCGLCCDHAGNMWVGTRQGLCVMQPGRDTFQTFDMKDGLPADMILRIQEDSEHFLWVSSSGGLSRIAVSEEGGRIRIKCVNFDEYDGLQGREFTANASLRTREGELLFGGANGFNLFRPESIGRDDHIPPVVLTGLQLDNKEVSLPALVNTSGDLVLAYDENNLSLEFAALSYINPRKNRYTYQLAGFDKGWTQTDGRNRRATYTNIDPGEYVFRVRASNSDGIWNDKGITLRVIIRPPFWKTELAYLLYVLAILTVLYLARMNIVRRARARFALAEERREALRIHELDRMKIKFFTNLSHEFRTPLSLILLPADKLIRSTDDPGRRQLATTIERNAKRLLHLVNQLLDLRKMEVNELKLNVGPGDIAQFIKGTADSFGDLAADKGIAFSYHSDIDYLPALFDRDKVERILFNLLSNAFKFTSTGESVAVELAVVEKDESSVLLELMVKDTGIGIPAALQGRIFESFFQAEAPGQVRSQGTGIGLAITKEFVEMHGGSIRVESKPDQGSCFTVLFPVTIFGAAPFPGATSASPGATALFPGAATLSPGAMALSPGSTTEGDTRGEGSTAEEDYPDEGNTADRYPSEDGHKPFRVLLVEDDDDFRFYLKENLAPLFTILEAANGKEGWQKTLSVQPDLVVSDVNMPVMDGLELAGKIKGDQRVSHIPIILLTALSGEQDQLRALGIGVNDYISKPFNVEILTSRIRNLLKFKGSVEQTVRRRISIQPGEVEVQPEETAEGFIRKAVGVLEKNIANADFSVDDWSRELGLSRTTLYKKVLAYSGETPIGLIRSFRMKHAAQLLEKTRHTVAEVAYMVGFNNPKYFARYFKEIYGKLPSIYQAEMRKKG